jgi:uncharacterized protein (DUF983 family)
LELKICPNCKSPRLANAESCPRCGDAYDWNQESFLNVGCLVLMLLFAGFLVLLPILMIAGMFIR